MRTASLLLLLASLCLMAAGPQYENNPINDHFTPKTKAGMVIPQVDDLTFLRRVYLDLTGILPTPEQVAAFEAHPHPMKRSLLIDELMESEAFVNRWTVFFEDMFWNQRITNEGFFRNAFRETLQTMIAENQSWKQMATAMIAGSGRATDPGASYLIYGIEFDDFDFRLDFVDDLVGNMTESFLGVQINCISCHDGAYHLETINKGLSVMTRDQFWGMAAFMAGVQTYLPMPASNYQSATPEFYYNDWHLVDIDDPEFERGLGHFPFRERRTRLTYEYEAKSETGDGMRVPRNGGIIEPSYLFSGEGVQEGETRREALARLMTSDRQFARNMVNRIWEQLIGVGFIDQPNGWDMGRLDPDMAAEYGSDTQARDWQLMEVVTGYFIQTDYDIRQLMRLVLNSLIYQADYAAVSASDSDQGLQYWVTDRRVRRLQAESVVDSIFQTLDTPRRYAVTGYNERTFSSAWEMPDDEEPRLGALFGNNGLMDVQALGFRDEEEYFFMQQTTRDLLNALGRPGRADAAPRDNKASVQTVLTLLNDPDLYYSLVDERLLGDWIKTLSADVDAGMASASDAVQIIFKRVLIRNPTEAEMEAASAHFQGRPARAAVVDLTWALINHHDFMYR